jgi:hypothetical protein
LHPFFCAGRTIAETGAFRFEFLNAPFSCSQFGLMAGVLIALAWTYL